MTNLPMKIFHQQAVLNQTTGKGRIKTTTFRGKVWDVGTYRMDYHGESLGCVELNSTTNLTTPGQIVYEPDGSINWQHQTDDGKAWLADSEGGYTVAEFEAFMRGWHIWGKPFGARFINGERNLWLHRLKWIGEVEDEH